MCRISLIVAGLLLTLAGAAAQPPAQVGSPTGPLSLEQEIKIGEIITDTDASAPLINVSFQFSVGGVVPQGVELHSLPSAAVELAPNLRGFGYIVVEELIGIVDRNNRKVVSIFQRWRPQHTTGQGK